MTQDVDIKKAMIWAKTWSNKKMLDDKDFKQLLAYESTSLWWFLVQYIINRATQTLRKLEAPITKKKLKKLRLVKFYLGCRYLLRALYGKRMLLDKSDKKGSKAKILLITQAQNWGTSSYGKKIKKEDRPFGEVIYALINRGYDVVAVEADVMSFLNLKTLREKRRYEKGLWIPFETYLKLKMIRKALKENENYYKIWQKLRYDQKFRETLSFEGNSIQDAFEQDLDKFFGKETFHAVLYIEMAKRLFDLEKPDLVLISCEYCIHGRSTTIACKMRGIPSLALQHGIIHPFHTGYFHLPDEINQKRELSPQYCPIPDKTAVYGPFVQNVLIEECNYPEDTIVITGQPRYDELAEPNKHFSRKEFCRRYGLDPNKKIALLATQPNPEKRRESFLSPTLRALKKLPNIQIVIKPHPNEDELWNKKIAQDKNVYATFIPKRSSIFEALYSCDIMLTINSTSAIEAMILDKPVVVVNLTGEIDLMPYGQSGAALEAYKEKDILPAVKKALYDENTKNQLKESRKKFIYEHAYKVDGKSTLRVAELIEEMIGSRSMA